MAVISAYLDDSGTHVGSPLSVVGGVLLFDRAELELQGPWQDTLHAYGVKVFHGADCRAGHGEFECLSFEDRARLPLLLARIVSPKLAGIVAHGVSPSDFSAVWNELSLEKIGISNDIYRVLLEFCWHSIGSLAQRLPAGDLMRISVEKGNKKASFINDLYQRVNIDKRAKDILRIDEIRFAGKECIPLQAADLLVNEIYRYHPNLGTDTMSDALRELTSVHDSRSIMLYDRDSFLRLLRLRREWDKTFIKPRSKRG